MLFTNNQERDIDSTNQKHFQTLRLEFGTLK